jgi:hypothetical protein
MTQRALLVGIKHNALVHKGLIWIMWTFVS